MACTRCGGTGKVLDPVIFVDVECSCPQWSTLPVDVAAKPLILSEIEGFPESLCGAFSEAAEIKFTFSNGKAECEMLNKNPAVCMLGAGHDGPHGWER